MKKFFVVFSVIAMMALSTLTVSAISGEGTEELPFIITSEEEMVLVADFPDCYFELGNDIELTEEWIANNFSGDFNGKNHTITVSRFGTSTRGGLFATMSGKVENLKVVTDNTTFGEFTYFGIIAGNCSGKIKKCSVSGKISVNENKKEMYYGGIAGVCSGEITNCSSDIYLNATLWNYSSSLAGSGRAIMHYGGICGKLTGQIDSSAAKNTLSINLTGNHQNAVMYYGGIVSDIETNGTSENSYSITNIDTLSGSGYYYHAGVAYKNSGTITNCYAVSESPTNNVYGISSKGTMSNCFYDKDVSGQSSTEYGTPKSTLAMKMKATYKNWDFDTVWGIDTNINNGYPYLLFELDSMVESVTFDYGTQKANVFVKETGTYTVIFADYDGTTFNKADIQPLTLKQGYNSIPTTLTLADGDKVFLWKDLTTLAPICEAAIVSSK